MEGEGFPLYAYVVIAVVLIVVLSLCRGICFWMRKKHSRRQLSNIMIEPVPPTLREQLSSTVGRREMPYSTFPDIYPARGRGVAMCHYHAHHRTKLTSKNGLCLVGRHHQTRGRYKPRKTSRRQPISDYPYDSNILSLPNPWISSQMEDVPPSYASIIYQTSFCDHSENSQTNFTESSSTFCDATSSSCDATSSFCDATFSSCDATSSSCDATAPSYD